MACITNSYSESLKNKEVITLYSDMVGDLFHVGHITFLKKGNAFAKKMFPSSSIRVVVGLLSDEDVRPTLYQ